MSTDATPQVRDEPDAGRFVTTVDGHDAELAYRRRSDQLVLVHTGVPDELEGHGIGGALVRAAVESAAEQGLTVVAECSFAAGWLDRHPDVASTVTVERPEG